MRERGERKKRRGSQIFTTSTSFCTLHPVVPKHVITALAPPHTSDNDRPSGKGLTVKSGKGERERGRRQERTHPRGRRNLPVLAAVGTTDFSPRANKSPVLPFCFSWLHDACSAVTLLDIQPHWQCFWRLVRELLLPRAKKRQR